MTAGAWSALAAEARRIADAQPPPDVCPCEQRLDDGRHVVAAATAELRRAGVTERGAT